MVDVVTHPRYLSLFSGVGGLDLAVRLALPESRCVCFMEGEIPAAEILAARMAEGTLDDAPIWSDVRSFDGVAWRGRVDGIIGGFPCQDLSVAGKRAGIGGKRSGLWAEFARIIGEVRPSWVFIENVPGLRSTQTVLHRKDIVDHLDQLADVVATAKTPKDRWYAEAHIKRLHRRLLKEHGISALLYVCCQLEELGYRVAVEEIAASDVGAPHKRERLFILAVDNSLRGRYSHEDSEVRSRGNGAVDAGGSLENTPRHGQHGCEREDGGCGRRGVREAGESVENPGCPRRWWAEKQAAIDWERPPDNHRGAGREVDDTMRGRYSHEGSEVRPRGNTTVDANESVDDSGEFPPGPSDTEAWGEVLVRRPWLRPAISQADAESILCGMADGTTDELDFEDRTDKLRGLGNAVVPVCAAVAFCLLAERLK